MQPPISQSQFSTLLAKRQRPLTSSRSPSATARPEGAKTPPTTAAGSPKTSRAGVLVEIGGEHARRSRRPRRTSPPRRRPRASASTAAEQLARRRLGTAQRGRHAESVEPRLGDRRRELRRQAAGALGLGRRARRRAGRARGRRRSANRPSPGSSQGRITVILRNRPAACPRCRPSARAGIVPKRRRRHRDWGVPCAQRRVPRWRLPLWAELEPGAGRAEVGDPGRAELRLARPSSRGCGRRRRAAAACASIASRIAVLPRCSPAPERSTCPCGGECTTSTPPSGQPASILLRLAARSRSKLQSHGRHRDAGAEAEELRAPSISAPSPCSTVAAGQTRRRLAQRLLGLVVARDEHGRRLDRGQRRDRLRRAPRGPRRSRRRR